MKKSYRIICLILVISLFTLFALGSGSKDVSSSSKNESSTEEYSEDITKNDSIVDYKTSNCYAKVYTDVLGVKYISVAFSIENTGNVDLFLNNGSIDVEKDDGTLEDTISDIEACPQIIKPGQTGWYYINTFYDGQGTGKFNLVPNPNIEKSNCEYNRLETSDTSVKNDTVLGTKVIGRVINNSTVDYNSVKVVANLYNSESKLISQASTFVDVSSSNKKSFEITFADSSFDTSEIAKYEVFAFPNQYNW